MKKFLIIITLVSFLTLQFSTPLLAYSNLRNDLKGSITYQETIYPQKSTTISFEEVKLEIPAGAVDKPVKISIEKLSDVNEMNPGLRNLTGGISGYRFKPDGIKFLKPIKVTIPYTTKGIAREKDIDNIYTYFYDEDKNYWERLERVNLDRKHKLVTSFTDHFTDPTGSPRRFKTQSY